MANLEKYAGHVRLHRLWAFATLQGELSYPEHIHLLDCELCRAALSACVEAETFGALLKLVNRSDQTEEDDSKAS